MSVNGGDLDPVTNPDRGCAGVPQGLFFPEGRHGRRMQRAQEICAGCPVLVQCAAWALPLVEAGDLTQCVIAGVFLATSHPQHIARSEAVAELQTIARGERAAPCEGAA